MKITLIHGQNHKGSTYHIARMVAEKIGGRIDEFFLPRDFGEGCMGCVVCLNDGRDCCPHAEKVAPILNSMLSSDVIIIGSPTYVHEMTAHLKGFFEHIFTAWMGHRPEEAMFSKIAVVISTAAILGADYVTKSLKRQMYYLGVPRVHRLQYTVMTTSWDEVDGKIRGKVETQTDKIARNIVASKGRARPGIKTKLPFTMLRRYHKNNDLPIFAPDKKYWVEKDWLGKARPW
jgi:multimeric flavodoxin WrbA